MSSTLYWAPLAPPPDKTLGTGLKFILREKYGFPVDVNCTADDVPFLSGVRSGSTAEDVKKDISALIEAIERYDTVRVFEGNW